jgi:hypothetical protein
MDCKGGVSSIVALFEEANRRAPRRSRASDGICASINHHKQNPTSDHEPDQRGLAHAGDLTHDPKHEMDCAVLFRELRERRDPRIRYMIFHRQYFLGPWSDGVLAGKRKPWILKPYTGPNSHETHAHISVGYARDPETNTSPWFEEDDMTVDELLKALESPRGQAALRRALMTAPGKKPDAGSLFSKVADIQGGVDRVEPMVKDIKTKVQQPHP